MNLKEKISEKIIIKAGVKNQAKTRISLSRADKVLQVKRAIVINDLKAHRIKYQIWLMDTKY